MFVEIRLQNSCKKKMVVLVENALKKSAFLFLFQRSARRLQAKKRKSNICFSGFNPTGDFRLIHEYQIDTLLFLESIPKCLHPPRRQGSLKEVRDNCDTRGQQKNFKCFGFVGFPVVYKHTCEVSKRLHPHDK
ncbi:hypothetical protein CDAR_31131 [Caerostris darwini]|uniref:Uncharacterized protein n=1 Tax=Caerostris darwini TaxID=1538125 RepID=A0AAV4RXP2_9ARAC|nr:hypothetical protein CDAR_31131 [Caerostris darwini]